MSKPPRDLTHTSSNTYFVTLSVYQRQSLFQSERVTDLFLSTLFSYRDQNKFLIHEFVVMSNHVHLLITPQSGVTLERTIQFIKGGFSFRAGRELGFKKEIWQRGYVDHRIRNTADYSHHQIYIWSNPVKARLSDKAETFCFSSASGAFRLDIPPQGLKPLAHAQAYGTTEVVPSHSAF
jgi:putative transposase